MDERGVDDYQSHRDAEEPVSEVVLRTVAAVTGRPPLDLPPLQESQDVGALNRLFASSTAVESLQFEYAECDVTVEPDRIRVRDRR